MSPLRVLGYVLLAVGVTLLIVGVKATDSWANWFTNLFAGRWTHGTLRFLIGGIACLIAGGLIVVFGLRVRRE